MLQANSQGWTGTSAKSGTGSFGTCCNEMDVWEANSQAAALTPYVCTVSGQTRCENDVDCGVGSNRGDGF